MSTAAPTGPEFRYSDLLPTGPDETPYRLVTTDGVSTFQADGRTFLQVEPEAIRRLTAEAMHDIAHYLRPAHLAQLRRIIDDSESSGNDRFVALDLLKNVNISAGGVLPMCQDTGTAIVMGKKSEGVLTGADDAEAISQGVYDAYTRLNLRYSQLAPLTMWEEKNTGTNLPAQIELYSTAQGPKGPEYKFLFMAKGGGSANKSFLFQETKAVLNPERMLSFLDEKIRSLGTAACPPYHLAVVIGGTSAEFALKTAKYAIAHYLRPAHLAQLRRIIDDPESSGNDRFVALDLLKNVNISAGGVLPMCQDTGTAIVMGKKSEGVLTGADDAEAISMGVYDAYTKLNLRYSQLAPLTMWDEKNTGTNLPAQIEIYSTAEGEKGPEYKFLFMAKGGGSANKSFLYQETKAVLNPERMLTFLDEKI
ncbi:MAG TPA: fumarate hydratase, partial [Marmoricola sp.]|nr:fumarate hydratase [Marmoricola sp.]